MRVKCLVRFLSMNPELKVLSTNTYYYKALGKLMDRGASLSLFFFFILENGNIEHRGITLSIQD